ncbi:hypothetical protein EHE19_002485 [Ruminiclostridium herbifermentans]|uniref:Uncharacterized protein n=2 Tax=Ruminiclostridium herbifermentans TaxID=2488810 RepID=A0A7H1VPV8_9FIRM|nr:hypothetical protein EHE19_002485 [Ruminiclostridium herbifermentans]
MLCTNTFALDNNTIKTIHKSLNIEILDDDSEKDMIVNVIKGNLNDEPSENINLGKDSKESDEYYKIYWIRDNLKKYSNIDELFKRSVVMWELLVKDSNGNAVSAVRAVKSNESWDISTGFQLKEELADFYLNPENLANILSSEKITPKQVKHARIKELYLDFYYIKAANKDYIIPFTHLYKEYNIENYKIYEANDFINIIKNQYVDPNTQIKDNQPASFGGKVNQNYLENNWAIVTIIFGTCAVFLGIVYIWKRNKKQTV